MTSSATGPPVTWICFENMPSANAVSRPAPDGPETMHRRAVPGRGTMRAADTIANRACSPCPTRRIRAIPQIRLPGPEDPSSWIACRVGLRCFTLTITNGAFAATREKSCRIQKRPVAAFGKRLGLFIGAPLRDLPVFVYPRRLPERLWRVEAVDNRKRDQQRPGHRHKIVKAGQLERGQPRDIGAQAVQQRRGCGAWTTPCTPPPGACRSDARPNPRSGSMPRLPARPASGASAR